MQDKPKILIVGAGPARLATAFALSVIQKLPEPKNLIPFKEEKNYLTGKKLPKRKRRK